MKRNPPFSWKCLTLPQRRSGSQLPDAPTSGGCLGRPECNKLGWKFASKVEPSKIEFPTPFGDHFGTILGPFWGPKADFDKSGELPRRQQKCCSEQGKSCFHDFLGFSKCSHYGAKSMFFLKSQLFHLSVCIFRLFAWSMLFLIVFSRSISI